MRKLHRNFTGVDDGSEDSADMFTLRIEAMFICMLSWNKKDLVIGHVKNAWWHRVYPIDVDVCKQRQLWYFEGPEKAMLPPLKGWKIPFQGP